MNVTEADLNNYTRGMATSGIQPKQADIDSICDIAGISPAQAIILLKKWPNWSDAVTHFFDDPSESLCEDVSSRQWEPQDNIPYAEDVGMSRPPSPQNFIDLTETHAKATALQEEEEQDLNKALAESAKDASRQENGTIASGQHFGPAERAHYPASQWSLAPIASAREVVDHPPPSQRRRLPGQPAFLRGAPETGYNAALLTIYHSIPLAREALIFPPLKIDTYGHSLDWWSGTSDENLKHISMQEVSPWDEDKRKFAAEIQCLMAFLDGTSRAYGSVDALSEMNYYQRTVGDSSASKLFEAWRRASVEDFPDEPLSQVFTTVATRGPEFEGAQPEEKDMLQIEGSTAGVRTQSEFLERIIWTDTFNTPPDAVWMERFGHILTMRLRNPVPGAKGLGIVPDEVWYLDRYMSGMRDTLLKMRQKRFALLQAINKLDRLKFRLTDMPSRQGNTPRINTRATLEVTKDLVTAVTANSTFLDDQKQSNIPATDPIPIRNHLDSLISNINQSLEGLERRKLELEEQTRVIMSDLQSPDSSTQPLRFKYMLHGVCTKPNIVYFKKLNQDLIGIEDDDEPHEIWQWWRTAWDESPKTVSGSQSATVANSMADSAPFSVQRISRQEVLDAIQNESSSAVLVYADETALTFRPESLSASLKEFVERDNEAFDEETAEQHVRSSNHSRGRSSDTKSTLMDGSNPFDDTSYSYNRQFTPMSTSTIRSLSGQPSPKRPRSSESMQNMNLMDDPPAYEDIAESSPDTVTEKKGNKIGYFAEQLLHNAEQNEPKS